MWSCTDKVPRRSAYKNQDLYRCRCNHVLNTYVQVRIHMCLCLSLEHGKCVREGGPRELDTHVRNRWLPVSETVVQGYTFFIFPAADCKKKTASPSYEEGLVYTRRCISVSMGELDF